MGVYTIMVTAIEKASEEPKVHCEIVSAEDELSAMDNFVKHYTEDLQQEILDIKVV